MNNAAELDELESGLTSGFWQRFKAHAEHEWGIAGPTYQAALMRAVQGGLGTEAETVARLKVITAQQAAIQALLQWPQERVSDIKRGVQQAHAAASPSRRGRL